MALSCAVCEHPQRAHLDELLGKPVNAVRLAASWNIPREDLLYHRMHHVPPEYQLAFARQDYMIADLQMQKERHELWLDYAEQHEKPLLFLSAAREIRAIMAQLTSLLPKAGPEIDNSVLQQTLDVIVQVLTRNHPQALAEVKAALLEFRSRTQPAQVSDGRSA